MSIDYNKFKVPELRKLCKDNNLLVKGVKKDLVDRLTTWQQNQAVGITDNLLQPYTERHLIVCNNFTEFLILPFAKQYFSNYTMLINQPISKLSCILITPPCLLLISHVDHDIVKTAICLAQLLKIQTTVYNCDLGPNPIIPAGYLVDSIQIEI